MKVGRKELALLKNEKPGRGKGEGGFWTTEW
jgi:hypothetical protein